MKIKILEKGDRIKSLASNFIAIEHSNGEVDIYRIETEKNTIKIDERSKLTIGYKENAHETHTIDGVTITSF